MQLTCRIPREIEAVPITFAGVDYLAVRREDLAALFHEGVAPEPVPLPAVKEFLTTARAARQKPAAKPKAARASSGGPLSPRVLSLLPGTATSIAEKLGANMKSVYSALVSLRKKGEVTLLGGRWTRTVNESAPEKRNLSIDPNAIEPLFLAALKTGPKSSEELIDFARKHGHAISSRFAVSTILEDHPDVIGGNGGRWTLAKGVPA